MILNASIEIYSTPQCGFCKKLKSELDTHHIAYISYDVSTDEIMFNEMIQKSNGIMSVPVTIIAKDTLDEQVLVGYEDAAKALHITDEITTITDSKQSVLTCPVCSYTQSLEIPTQGCMTSYTCDSCHTRIQPKKEDCCVFCSYGDSVCPMKKSDHTCSDGVCSV